ncbi:unnamed protein product [Rhizoctonia solani]|uniref:Cytochrome P450 n=1 Tax=Rhizoctonia solani TaxID=456999 RepID=A0A8H3HP89_9AGAM|nr:unnamed protein product [Rhizoctonia solani]
MLLFIVCFTSGLLALLVLRWHRTFKLLVPLPGPPSKSFLTGHFKDMFGLHGIEFQGEVLKTYGPTVRMAGALGEEFIFTLDPSFIHTVFVKDRSKFGRSKGGTLMIRSVFGPGLAALTGEEHRQQRKLLNPVFTEQHLRERDGKLFVHGCRSELTTKSPQLPIFTGVAKQACQAIDQSLSTDVIDMIPWTTAAALELIGEAGMGYSFNSFAGERNEYSIASKSVARLFVKLVPFIPIYPYLARLPITHNMLSYFPFPLLRQVLKVTNIQNEQAEQIIRERKDMLANGADLESVTGRGKDILTQLIPVKANEEGIFIFAGYETTSSTIARILDVLANNPEIQDRLRSEVLERQEEGVLELPYLDAVVKETLRLYAPASYISRICEEDTVVPLSYPVSTPSGTITSLPIKKGTRLALSVTFSNRDEKAWGKKADEFWPDRWLEAEQPGNPSLQCVYSSMMTFGIGQYACIGFKFAVMEIS